MFDGINCPVITKIRMNEKEFLIYMEFPVTWDGNMAFSSVTPSGHNMKMDATETVGGKIVGQGLRKFY